MNLILQAYEDAPMIIDASGWIVLLASLVITAGSGISTGNYATVLCSRNHDSAASTSPSSVLSTFTRTFSPG